MHRRTRRTLWIVAAVLLLLAVAVFLRSKAPPEAARLLPESDGIIYINLKPFRTFFHKELKPPQRVPDYQQFVDATGIDWERDLDQVAIAPAPHARPQRTQRASGVFHGAGGQAHRQAAECLAGRARRLAARPTPATPSTTFPRRAARCAWRRSAMTWWPSRTRRRRSRSTPCIDRHRTAALPFAGSTLLTQHYHEVPLLALAWGVGQIGLPFSESGAIQIFGFSLPLEDDSTIIASVTPGLPG